MPEMLKKTPEIYIAELDFESTLQDFLALGLFVKTHEDYELIFQSDQDRLAKLITLMRNGGRPVAVMCIMVTPDGAQAGSFIFDSAASADKAVVHREVEVCRQLLAKGAIECPVH